MSSRLLQVALNGAPVRDRMPLTPDEIARDAARCVAAGATSIHVHAFDEDGAETFEDRHVARMLRAVRGTCPGVPINMTTFATIEPDPGRRLALISGWTELPDLIPANQGEEGISEIASTLAARGVGVEACLLSLADAHAFATRRHSVVYERVFIEPMHEDPIEAVAEAEQMSAVLDAAASRLERACHGVGEAAWAVLEWAARQGHGLRAGLEDTSRLPDGTTAQGNAALVAAAVEIRTSLAS